MKTLFTRVEYTVSLLIEKIEMGEIGLPEIQRPFVWTAAKVRDLFDSMFKGFPVGYFLFWSSTNGSAGKQIGSDIKQLAPRLLIVDGQQRLTSLFSIIKGKAVLNEDYQIKKIRVAFKPTDGTFEVTDAAIEKNPEFISDISEVWSQDKSHLRFVNDYISKIRNLRELSPEEEDVIGQNIDHLYDLHHYPFTALEVSAGVDEEQVAEIFVRINSQGVKLNQADFILTLMSVYWDQGRADLEKFSRGSRIPSTSGASPFNYFLQASPDQMLRVAIGLGFRRARLKYAYSILRGKDLQTEKFSDEMRDKQFEVLKLAQERTLNIQNWHEFLKTLVGAGFKGSSMVSSQVGLLYTYIVFLIGKYDFKVEHYQLRKIISKWFFMQSMTRRYTGSPETIMEGDFAKFRDCSDSQSFINVIEKIITDTLTEDFWNITLPNEMAVSSATSPAIFAYYASLNILDANVLFSNMKVSELTDPSLKAKKSPIERHHLFPKNYLKSIEITDIKETNQLANFALVEWSDNIDISDKKPAEYLPEYLNRFSPEEITKMYKWHALPENWQTMQYFDFLESRRKLMAKIIRTGFDKL